MNLALDSEHRHKVEVHLALSAVSVTKPSDSRFCIHTSPNNCPSLPNSTLRVGQNSQEVAEQLFERLTGATPTWLPIHQICTIDGRQEGAIIILYGVTMPEKAPLMDESVEWVDFETLSKSPELLRMVGYACNAYRIGTSL